MQKIIVNLPLSNKSSYELFVYFERNKLDTNFGFNKSFSVMFILLIYDKANLLNKKYNYSFFKH
jgi:hypothetical protein